MAATLELFGLPENWKTVAPFYLEAFEDVPPDLVIKALKSARRNLKFFPKPSELRAPIVGELGERMRALTKLRLAKGSIRPPSPVREPLTEEQEAKVREAVTVLEHAARRMTERPAPKATEEPAPPCDVEPASEAAAE